MSKYPSTEQEINEFLAKTEPGEILFLRAMYCSPHSALLREKERISSAFVRALNDWSIHYLVESTLLNPND